MPANPSAAYLSNRSLLPRSIMASDLKRISKEIAVDLELDGPPVQITYLDEPPRGVPEHVGAAPSVCTFFSEGRSSAFYAALPAHEACEIGAYVMGIPPAGELGHRLTDTLQFMQGEGYLRPGEEAAIPRNPSPPRYVAYGPLGSLPVFPTSVLIFANPRAAMLAMEAAGQAAPLNGRPMCSIIPVLHQGAPVALSLGCTGSRIYARLRDDQMVVGIRGDWIQEFSRRLRSIRHANEAIAKEDRRRQSTFPRT